MLHARPGESKMAVDVRWLRKKPLAPAQIRPTGIQVGIGFVSYVFWRDGRREFSVRAAEEAGIKNAVGATTCERF